MASRVGRPVGSFYGARPWRTVNPVENEKQLDQMIQWKSRGPNGLLWYTERSELMNRQFTIELRVDYADSDKNEVMRQALQIAGRHMYATAELLGDGVKPQIAMFSDDFFDGHAEIALIDDVLQKGKDMLKLGDDEGVSSELMAACRPEPK